MLKRYYAKKEDIPTEYLSLYEEKNGRWELKGEIEGLVPRERVEEFRENNLRITKELEALRAQVEAFKGIDPTKMKEQIEEARKKEEAALIKEGKIEELLAKRTEAMKAELEKKIKELEARAKKAEESLAKNVIEKGLTEAAAKGKVLSTAVDDVVRRGREVFRMVDGTAKALAPDGSDMFGKDGKPLTIEEWVSGIAASAPHLFEPTSGGGAAGAASGGGGVKKNPWSKEHFNLTEQGRIFKANPAEARRLAAEAGKKI